MYDEVDSPLCPVMDNWETKITRALEVRAEQWGDFAREAMFYFDGNTEWLFDDKIAKDPVNGYMGGKMPQPMFRVVPNKVAEMVQLFGPICYYQDHVRTVKARAYPDVGPNLLGDPNDPQVQMMYQMLSMQQMMRNDAVGNKADILSSVLNYIPQETDLKRHGREAIGEALITGLSWLKVEVEDTPVGRQLVTASRVTPWDVVLDPDAECWDDVRWMAIRSVRPYWEWEEQFDWESGSLKKYAKHQSHDGEASSDSRDRQNGNRPRHRESSNDLLEVWEIYSKQGFGHRFQDVKNFRNKDIKQALDGWGDYCYLAMVKGLGHPINLHPDLFSEYADGAENDEEEMEEGMEERPSAEESFIAVQWPIPFWADRCGWPIVPVKFMDKPGQVYPLSLLKPGAGYMRFLYWAWSFLATKLANSSDTVIGILKQMSEDFKADIQSQSGRGLKFVEIAEAEGMNINQILSVFEMPDVGPEHIAIINKFEDAFAKATGLNDLVYGFTEASMRSATEANVKQTNTQGRIEDFARQVDDAFSLVARRQAMACRWFMDGEDVAAMVGPIAAQVWEAQIMSMDLEDVVKEFDFRVESGSARRPDTDTDIANANQAVQVWGPILAPIAMNQGQVDPLNALMEMWGRAYQIPMERFFVQPPPPPPMMGPPPEQPMPA